MTKISRTLFGLGYLVLFSVFSGGAAMGADLPADIFFRAGFQLQNQEVQKQNHYLFTKVNIKPRSDASASLITSKARLYAQRNFARHLSGQVQWEANLSAAESRLAQALYGKVASFSAVLKGLTLIHRDSQNGLLSFIYAIDAPTENFRKIRQSEAVDRIQTVIEHGNAPLDYLTYFELALRQPKVFNPRLAVKPLSKRFGPNFIFFLLGIDLTNPADVPDIPKLSTKQLGSLDTYEIALLLGQKPYDATLVLAFAKRLLETRHEELAKLVVKHGWRFEKLGETHDQILNLARQLKVEPSGAYSPPVSSISFQQLFREVADAGVELTPLSEAILTSLGDVPLKPSKQIFTPTLNHLQMNKEDFLREFHTLQEKQKIAISKNLFETMGDVLYDKDYPMMAFCFWHQALYMDRGNRYMQNKIMDKASRLDVLKYSKLLSSSLP